MSAITKERIELFIKNPIDNGLTRGEQMELARIALASLEAEPVAWLYSASFERGHVEGELTDAPGCDMPVYTSPSAPVSVPEVVGWEDVPEEITEDDIALASAWAHGFNQCRSAMLQGDEPSTDNTNQQFESLSRGDK